MSEQNSHYVIPSSDVSTGINMKASGTSSSAQALSDTRPRRILENFVVIWLDSNISESNGDNQSQLRRIVNSIKTFANVDECIDFLPNIEDQKVFLIVPDTFDEAVVSRIHDMSQVDSIYIFCDNKIKYEQKIEEWRKVKGIFADIALMADQLKKDIRQCEQDLTSISIVPLSSVIDFNDIGPLFMYSQLLTEILLEMPYDEQAKQQFVNFLRTLYIDNNATLRLIDEFERDYDRYSPIWWYTKESFLYSMLNRALRTQDIEIIIKMGFFIQDLHKKLLDSTKSFEGKSKRMSISIRDHRTLPDDFQKNLLLFQNLLSRNTDQPSIILSVDSSRDNPDIMGELRQKSEQIHLTAHQPTKMIVYRGQGMLHTEFEKMKNSQGGLLSFNNFLSTTIDRPVAFLYADSSRMNSNLTGVLFQMEVDLLIPTTPFVSLDDISYYKDTEKEILFSMHTVFRIGEIEPINEKVWQVQLTLTSDYDEQVIRLTKYIRKQISGSTVLHRLGMLMIEMDQLNKAKEIYTKLLETTPDDDWNELALLHHQLGYVNDNNGDPVNALSHFQQALKIFLTHLSSNDPEVALTYSNIGMILLKLGDLDGALEHHQRALNNCLRNPQSCQLEIASLHNNIGGILNDQMKYADALKSHERALEIELAYLPPYHPLFATTYSSIGAVHQSMKDYSTALSYIEKTLEIRQKSLPPTHRDLAMTHSNMAVVFESLDRYTEAVEHASQAVDIASHTFESNHFQAQMYQNQLDFLRGKLLN